MHSYSHSLCSISQREGYELFALEKLSWEQEKGVPDEN